VAADGQLPDAAAIARHDQTMRIARMKTLTDQLALYGAYHRDPRNIATHIIGVPMIMLAVVILLSRPMTEMGPTVASPALLAALAAIFFYSRLDFVFGIVMAVLIAVMLAVGQWLAVQTTAVWLVSGVGLFVVGWIIQFIGHWFEGRKPAFVDDLVGLLVGPLFVVAEIGFVLGMRREVQADVEKRIGPVRRRGTGGAASSS